MKTMQQKIEAVKSEFERRKKLTIASLMAYPDGTLGNKLGWQLRNYGKNTPEQADIFKILIANDGSLKQEIGLHYFLFGNGCLSVNTLFSMGVGLLLCPFEFSYFIKRYKDGKKALRFYDVNHFNMLHLPVQRIKDTFLIR